MTPNMTLDEFKKQVTELRTFAELHIALFEKEVLKWQYFEGMAKAAPVAMATISAFVVVAFLVTESVWIGRLSVCFSVGTIIAAVYAKTALFGRMEVESASFQRQWSELREEALDLEAAAAARHELTDMMIRSICQVQRKESGIYHAIAQANQKRFLIRHFLRRRLWPATFLNELE